jgi:hypothetical protein
LPLSRFISGEDGVPLPTESGVWADYIRQGFKIGLVSPERAKQSEAVAIQLQREAESAEWRRRIANEFRRISEIRERGIRPTFVLEVPPAYEALIDEVGPDFDFQSGQFNRRSAVSVY